MAFVTGDKQLDRRLKHLQKKGAKKAVASGMRKGLRVIVKGIKSEIPANMKDAKKLIGSRFGKTRNSGGELVAKAGAAVGAAGKAGTGKGAKFKKKKSKDRSGHSGVGIGARNIHWYILGTKDRRTSKSPQRHSSTGRYTKGKSQTGGHSTGRMLPQMPHVVQNGFNKSAGDAMSKITSSIREGIDREAKAG